MKALKPILSFIVVALLSTYAIEAWAQNCLCSGDRQDNFTDEDSELRWTFETHLAVPHQTRPEICYFMNVLNKSARDFVKVKWRVALYYRERIPSQKDSPSCIPIEGQMNPATSSGKLIHGLARNYDTRVRQPRDGWSGEEKKQGATDQEKQPTVLRAELQIYGDEKSWAHLIITSSASLFGTKSTLFYEIRNAGNMEVAVLTNIPVVPSMVSEVPMVQRPHPVSAGNYQSFKATTDGPFERRSATVVVFDKTGEKILGANLIGLYAPTGGKPLRSDEELWDKLLN